MPEKLPQFNKPEKPPLSTGEARKLNELTSEKWQEHLLLFSQVKNKVFLVNPEILAPLKLKEEESSPLGLFVEAAFKERPAVSPKGKQTMEVWPQHTRSAILGRMFFADKNGVIYRDIDLKGVGYFGSYYEQEVVVGKLGKSSGTMAGYTLPTESFTGILDEDYALFDYQMSEMFTKKGIRTTRTIAIIKLEELISGGRKISLDEARNQGFLGKDTTPVIEIRAFATKLRIADLYGETKKLIIEDAKKIVSQELGLKETVTDEKYAKWFAKTLGRNVALIHKNGYFHDYLTPHNITLDCRIPDLDGVSELTDGRNSTEDKIMALRALDKLLDELLYESYPSGSGVPGRVYYKNLFYKAYEAAFPQKKREKYFEKMEKKTAKNHEL